MKKIILLVIVLLFLVLVGCRREYDDLSIVSYNDLSDIQTSDVIINITTNEESNESSQVSSNSIISSKNETANKICQHTYNKTVKNATCTENGAIEYKCSKCGHSYSEVIKSGHDFSKYLCERCGVIDKSMNIYSAVNAWVSKYGKPTGNGLFFAYPQETAEITVTAPSDNSYFYIGCGNQTNEIYFDVYVSSDDMCTVTFFKNETRGSYEIKKSAFSSEQKIEFVGEDFYTPSENPVDKDVFATESAKIIDMYMKRVENEILIPKMGIKLTDIGFTSY